MTTPIVVANFQENYLKYGTQWPTEQAGQGSGLYFIVMCRYAAEQ